MMLSQLINQGLACPAMDVLMVLATTVGLAVMPALGLLLPRSPGASRRRGLGLMLAALVVTLLLTLALQQLVARPRPQGMRLLLAMPDSYAFPSGHAALAWCAAILVALARRSVGVVLPCLLGALLVSASRVYLGHHHPTDLVGGALLGAAVGTTCYGLFLNQDTLQRRLRWLLWPQLALVLLVSLLAYLHLLPSWFAFPYADKLMHFLLFGMLAFWLHLWLGGRVLFRMPLALLITFGCALPEELAQGLSPVRSLEALDLLCDLAGILTFVWLGTKLMGRSKKTQKTPEILNNPGIS